MSNLERNSWALGWVPNVDPLNGPANGLLRGDNLVLDELGVVALRLGSAKINNVSFGDTDVHSLYTAILSGTRYRFAGAVNAVYSNGSSILSGVNGSGDIAFGSHQGQVLMARGTTTKKTNDGSTVTNWGIGMTGGVPTVAQVAADKKVFISGALAEAPALVWTEDDGTGAGYAAGPDGTANAAAKIRPSATTGRAVVTKTFAAETDFTAYDGGATGVDDDTVAFYLYLTEPAVFSELTLLIDVNASAGTPFALDYFAFHFIPTPGEVIAGQLTSSFDPTGELTGLTGLQRRTAIANLLATGATRGGTPAFVPRPDAGVWFRVYARRGDFLRYGTTPGKGWNTVKAVRVVGQFQGGGSGAAIEISDVRIFGGSQTTVTGQAYYKYVYVNNTGIYQAKSAPSAASVPLLLQSNGATVTVPADGSRDGQVNEIWLFRQDDALDQFYRVAVKTGVSGGGAYAITDPLSDVVALTTNIALEIDNGPPPSGILGIAGPYYDRTFVLTATDLYPSRRLSPDTFSAGQVIHIAGSDETAYWLKKTLGGLYIGTSKDIYRLEGTGAENPDGSIDFVKTSINIDHPPINDAIAQDGNLLIYFAADGWRVMAGQGSTLLTGQTSLLYRGYTRHGVSPVNIATGRFRATIARGQLVCVTPEGASTTSSNVLYRNVPPQTPQETFMGANRWYRHTYTPAWRCVYTEPDGTVIASDTAGYVRVLDTGTQDDGANIPVVLWTKSDDDGVSFARKVPGDLHVKADTGNVNLSVGICLDGAAAAALTNVVTQNGIGVSPFDLTALGPFKTVQLKATGSFSTLRFYGFTLGHRPRPVPMIGRIASTNVGYTGEKVLTALKLTICTLGAARVITPLFDNVADSTTFTITTDAAEVVTEILQFPSTRTATDIAFAVDGDLEVLEWEPIVLYQLPTRIKIWENKPLVRAATRRRFGGFSMQVNTFGVTATLTPVVDGVDQAPLTVTTSDLSAAVLTIQTVVGRDLWCRIACGTPFSPLAVEPIVIEALPQWQQGLTPRNRFGYQGIKTISGMQVRLCTLGVARQVTAVLDGVSQPAVSVTSSLDNPIDLTVPFVTARETVEMALLFDGNVELYDWQAIITARRPLGVTAWDSGPLDLGDKELVWLREMFVKVRAGGDLTVTPYFDGVAFPAVTVTPVLNAETIVRVPVGRAYVGRQPRLIITSAVPFYPYSVKCVRRTSGLGTQKPSVTVPVTLDTGGA